MEDLPIVFGRRDVCASDEEDDIFWLEDESQNGDRGHPHSAALPENPNERTAALEMTVADDPDLARLGGIPPAERVFMYLQVSTLCASHLSIIRSRYAIENSLNI